MAVATTLASSRAGVAAIKTLIGSDGKGCAGDDAQGGFWGCEPPPGGVPWSLAGSGSGEALLPPAPSHPEPTPLTWRDG